MICPNCEHDPCVCREQDKFWRGEFGDRYIERNNNGLPSALAFWCSITERTGPLESVLELGANIGTNLQAIGRLVPGCRRDAVEINAKAAQVLRQNGRAESVFERSLLDFTPPQTYDLAFTKGVLIHVAPSDLGKAYETLYRCSRRFVLVAEYYSPTPVEVEYRGHTSRLWKRDFAGELMDRYPLRLVDYGFQYRRDPSFPADDVTHFLMEKR